MAINDATKLRLYNGALRYIGDRSLSSLTVNEEARRVLDGEWGPANEVVKWALERGEWNFAIRAVQLDYNPSVIPSFGFDWAFDKPDDIRRLAGLYVDEYMRVPLTNLQYQDEATFWFADPAVIYVRYVSDDTEYGLNDAAWPEVFKEFIELRLASGICERLTNSKGLGDRIEYKLEKAMKEAKSHDAMQEGVKFFPRGSWAGSRSHGYSRYDK